ncbi:hypothetical protein SAM23877_2465 [Streptomyces ambofaciens ATCC 23877]|uniref:Fibronectin type III-like domain-containing protein n=1 Tax=Streptomyces ambofaciens (strain ATCC 23877 / 3486 / DSM 40053 / JCM 4204 / NBRC 12836 / NRRL B-2516) TaxID=278992 RepID=A0A0K2ARA7_STRA7|nr:hypothetical protein SAM23877_2465 [Streptomyces ambofaciens ATCC 23877]
MPVRDALAEQRGEGLDDARAHRVVLDQGGRQVRPQLPGGQRVPLVALLERDDIRPARRLAGFAGVEAAPGERVEATVELPRRAFEVWDEATGSWAFVKGSYELQIGRSIADRRITATITV